MTDQTSPDEMATPEQLAELRTLADAAGEDVPAGMRVSEAAQRIVELRSSS